MGRRNFLPKNAIFFLLELKENNSLGFSNAKIGRLWKRRLRLNLRLLDLVTVMRMSFLIIAVGFLFLLFPCLVDGKMGRKGKLKVFFCNFSEVNSFFWD